MGGAEGGTRTPTSYLTRPSNVRVCQFRHFGPGSDYNLNLLEQHRPEAAILLRSTERNPGYVLWRFSRLWAGRR